MANMYKTTDMSEIREVVQPITRMECREYMRTFQHLQLES